MISAEISGIENVQLSAILYGRFKKFMDIDLTDYIRWVRHQITSACMGPVTSEVQDFFTQFSVKVIASGRPLSTMAGDWLAHLLANIIFFYPSCAGAGLFRQNYVNAMDADALLLASPCY